MFLSLPLLVLRDCGLGGEGEDGVVVPREIASSTHTGQPLEGVREHAEGEEFFRGDQWEHGLTVGEEPVRLTTVLSECVMCRVTRSAVALIVRGHGTLGVRVPAVVYRHKRVRCAFCGTLAAEERGVQLFAVRRGAAILECKFTSLVLLISSK